MAYDPKDPADKKIVDDLIKAALEEQAAEHEQDVQGLKDKNKELLGKLKEAQKGKDNAEELAQVQKDLEETQGKLKQAEKDLKQTNKQLTEYKQNYENEAGVNRQLLVDTGLTDALTKAKVAPEFQPAVKALLSGKVELKEVDGKRVAVVGDKALGDFVNEWSQGDEGKFYVGAPGNSGAGGPGNKVPGGNSGKTLARSVYEANPGQYAGFFAEGGTLIDG